MNMKHLTLNAQIPTKAVDEESTLSVLFAQRIILFPEATQKKKNLPFLMV